MIRAGDLRHRVAIQRATEGAASSTGNKTLTWSTLRTVYASLTLQSGSENVGTQTTTSSATYLVGMRWQYGITITPKDRLVLGARIFDIDSVADPEGRSRELQLIVRERTS